jgi:hypothetical protein
VAERGVLIGVKVNAVVRVVETTRPALKNWHPISSAIAAQASAARSDRAGAPSNFSQIGFANGDVIGGGATTRIGGKGMPGSIGARRIARMTAARPCPECQASF